MSFVDRIKWKAASTKPRFKRCVVLARPLPLIADEKPPAGEDFWFKAVFDPNDPHLAQIEPPDRLEMSKTFFARGGVVCLGIHRPTDTTVCKLWMLTHSPLASEKHQGVIPIKLARDEAYLLDLWTHPDYRRQAVALTLAYELSAVAHERYPYLRWVYTHAHKDNEISRHLMEDVYGCWQVQEVTEVQIGNYVDVVPGSDSPKFGPFSKKGRHSGDGFSVPGRPRAGDRYRDYHHAEGFATARSEAVMADDWYWSGPEWFDNDHPLDASDRLGTVESLPRPLPDDVLSEEQAS